MIDRKRNENTGKESGVVRISIRIKRVYPKKWLERLERMPETEPQNINPRNEGIILKRDFSF
jgi:hypothetical protein